jgi:hypothetical protein
MNWTGRAGAWAVPSRYWHLPHVEPGLRPTTSPKASGSRITRNTRRAGGAHDADAPPVAPQTALPPAEVVAEPFANQPAAHRNGSPSTPPRQPRPDRSTWRGSPPAPSPRPRERSPHRLPPQRRPRSRIRPRSPRRPRRRFRGTAAARGHVGLGANVVAFALSTQHAVGERVYPRFRSASAAPRCAAATSAPPTSRRTGS